MYTIKFLDNGNLFCNFASVHHHSKSNDQDVIQIKFKDLKKVIVKLF